MSKSFCLYPISEGCPALKYGGEGVAGMKVPTLCGHCRRLLRATRHTSWLVTPWQGASICLMNENEIALQSNAMHTILSLHSSVNNPRFPVKVKRKDRLEKTKRPQE